MSRIDLRTPALRLEAIEMLRIHAERRKMAQAPAFWRRWVWPN